MQINCIKVGELETNCYLLEKDNEIIIIDPGAESNKIIESIKDKKVVACLVTHHHFDHVGALDKILSHYKIKENNYKGNNFKFDIINTPGHTDDSISFFFEEENIMFVGDFIFKCSIGRTDLGGNDIDMINSLEMISNYDDNIVLFPGHGPSTILKDEKKRFSYYY